MKMWNLVGMCMLGVCVILVAVCGVYTDKATTRNAEAVKKLNVRMDTEIPIWAEIDASIAAHTARLDALDAICTESATRLDALNTRFATLDAALDALSASSDLYVEKHIALDRATAVGFRNLQSLMVTLHPDAGWMKNGVPIEVKKAETPVPKGKAKGKANEQED